MYTSHMLRFIIIPMNLKKIRTTSNLEGKEQGI
jgi:hypothetical protein